MRWMCFATADVVWRVQKKTKTLFDTWRFLHTDSGKTDYFRLLMLPVSKRGCSTWNRSRVSSLKSSMLCQRKTYVIYAASLPGTRFWRSWISGHTQCLREFHKCFSDNLLLSCAEHLPFTVQPKAVKSLSPHNGHWFDCYCKLRIGRPNTFSWNWHIPQVAYPRDLLPAHGLPYYFSLPLLVISPRVSFWLEKFFSHEHQLARCFSHLFIWVNAFLIFE